MTRSFFTLILLGVISYSYSQSNALHFDGKDDYVTIANPDPGYENVDMTVQLWVKPESGQRQSADIISSHTSQGKGGFVIEQNGSNDNQYVFAWGGTGPYQVGNPFQLEADEWQHITAVKDNGENLVYVNGTLVSTRPLNPEITKGTENLILGHWGLFTSSPRYWKGAMDDLRIWNRALNPHEIQDNYHNELQGNENGLTLYMKFDQGLPCGDNATETRAVEEVTNNNGTLINFALETCSSNWVEQEFSHLSGKSFLFEERQYIKTDGPLLPTTNSYDPYTIEFWMKTSYTGGKRKGIITQYDFRGFGNEFRFGIEMDANGRIAYFKDGSILLRSAESVNDDDWHHIIVRKDARRNVNIYVDGNRTGSAYDVTPCQAAPVCIGDYPNARPGDPYFRFIGHLDNIVIWNKSLGSAEMQSRFQSCFNCGETGQLLALTCEEFSGLTTYDCSGRGNHISADIQDHVPRIHHESSQDCDNNVVWNPLSFRSVTSVSQGIQKTVSGNTSWNAGASSLNYLPENTAGWVEYTIPAPERTKNIFIFGLGEVDNSDSYEEILFSVMLQQGNVLTKMGMKIFEKQFTDRAMSVPDDGIRLSLPSRDLTNGQVVRLERTAEGKIIYSVSGYQSEVHIATNADGSELINQNRLIIDSSIKSSYGEILNLRVSDSWVLD